ncbi:CHAT domain-containing protein [Dactylosporangium vinaceum]|uniref:CHAT domain-containing protein n=1 Tax=Dactylosporangium vinaceum TaxID=53362 RepID=A0ABV5MRT5_9ACTN|nr:CHAT domain-containing protein [Dactylosporangium vinaceum]UAC00341.1 CHAT domain-containing protein [Dactylosporangium vinaceum]
MAEPGLVTVAYAPGDAAHVDAVRDLWILVRAAGFDARLVERDGVGADTVVLETGALTQEVHLGGGPEETLAWLRAGNAARTTRHDLRIAVAVAGSRVRSTVTLAGAVLCERDEPLPFGRDEVWDLLDRPGAEARLARLGQRLSAALFDADALDYVTVLLTAGVPGTTLDVVVDADGPAHELPFELLRLTDQRVLVAVDGVRLTRSVTGVPAPEPTATPGPLKILVAVGAPERTSNPPLDVEAEMQAIVSVVGGVGRAEVTILEVAGPAEIADALRRDAYHALHLSAHGSPYGVELEDRDGNAVEVSAEDLVRALRRGGRPVPLIVLSSCGGAADADAGLAVTLLRHGAGRVLAMQTTITDWYATRLLTAVYRSLAEGGTSVAAAVARARAELFDETAGKQPPVRPEYAVPALFAASDGPLWESGAPAVHLQNPTDLPTGTGVRELLLGDLVGRRGLLRIITQTLRDEVAGGPLVNGVVLTGPAGIGKTALAGRVVHRLRDDTGDPWTIHIHTGAGFLVDDVDRLAKTLRTERLLLVFDDFEQNLTVGGGAFADPGFGEAFATLAGAAERGKILVTTRYPVPSVSSLLRIDVPPLTDAELSRLLLRMPALRELSTEDLSLIVTTVGGHPRLVEFVDALLHGGARLPEVTQRLRTLLQLTPSSPAPGSPLAPLPAEPPAALESDLPPSPGLPADTAAVGGGAQRSDPGSVARQAVALGAQDVLLTELLDLLTPDEREALLQLAVFRIPVGATDLAYAVHGSSEAAAAMEAHLARLRDLTLATPAPASAAGASTSGTSTSGAPDVSAAVVEPWLREALTKAQGDRHAERHTRAGATCRWIMDEGRAEFATVIEGVYHLDGDALADFATAVLPKLAGEGAVASFLGEVTDRLPAKHQAYPAFLARERDALEAVGSIAAAAEKGEEAVRLAARSGDRLELSAALDDQGRLLHRLGRLADARRAYERALAIDTELAAADPVDVQLQRNLGLSHQKLIGVALDDSDPDSARTAAEEALRIRRRLAAADADSALAWDLALCLFTAAFLDPRPHLEEALAIWRRLATDDADNPTLLANQFDVLNALAGLDPPTYTTDAFTIADRLTDIAPENLDYQRKLLQAYWRLADLDTSAGDLGCAAGHVSSAVSLAERLAGDDSVDAQRDLATAYRRQAEYFAAAARPEEVRGNLERSTEIAEALVHRFPRTGLLHRDLAESRERLGDWLRDCGDPATARALYRQALSSRRRRAALDPEDTASRLAQAEVYARIAELDEAAGHPARARRRWQEALGITRELRAESRASYFEQKLATTAL